jgi:hypothetical protein
MKPICVPCRRFYRMKKSGFAFVEGMPRGGNFEDPAPIGTRAPERWQPYKVWFGDLWRCPDCGAEVITGTGYQPMAERHHDDFRDLIERLGATLQINDC